MLAFLPLNAAPDPDLFDGRITQQPSGGGAASPESAGGQELPESGAGTSAGGTAGSTTEVGEGSVGQSGSGASSPSGGTTAAAGSNASDTKPGESRDFSQIGGIRGGGSSQGVEVNTSKTAPTSPAGDTTRPATGRAEPEEAPPGRGTGGSGSQPSTGSGSGDYGDTLPSGI